MTPTELIAHLKGLAARLNLGADPLANVGDVVRERAVAAVDLPAILLEVGDDRARIALHLLERVLGRAVDELHVGRIPVDGAVIRVARVRAVARPLRRR